MQYLRELVVKRLHPMLGFDAGYYSWYAKAFWRIRFNYLDDYEFLRSTATDLAHHLRIFRSLKDLVDSGYDKSRAEHHKLLLFLMMTAADLSDQTKDWKSSRNAAVSYLSLFLFHSKICLFINPRYS